MKKIFSKILVSYIIVAILAIGLKAGDIIASADTADYPNQVCTILSQDLIYGDTDSLKNGQVSLLQKFLVNRGYSINGDTFGTFGYGTQNAVSNFQVNNNLLPTGFVGANTRVVIQNISCNNTQTSLPNTIQVSNIPVGNCGVNTGWVWNGTNCVNTCDNNHPWDPTQQKCSNGYGSGNYYYNNGNYTGNCSGYYYQNVWNGRYCVAPQDMQNCGTDNTYFWNGSQCVAKNVTKYLCLADGQYYTDSNYCTNRYGSNYTVNNYTNNAYGYNNINCSYYNNCSNTNTVTPTYTYSNNTPTYTTYTYTNNTPYNTYTSSYPSYSNYNSTYNCDYTCDQGYSYNQPIVKISYYTYTTIENNPAPINYIYLGSTNSGYYNNYWDCGYIRTGYYDVYGRYHSN